ncbi:Rz1-like lysis system protein LysC [Rahnella sp. BCC 1045]|uniref:Rz1-like lysis system protein LysC n=1 Tax=Rahnella sp. BCC 1045 TaxID=2816251 RepID=UPI0020B7C3C9|nr:Rz1-like lysis system protein LysC [Rahnella sp. BCC 1045]
MSGCTRAPNLPTPAIIYVGCPKVSSCPIPESHPKTNGDLSEDIRQLESALVSCALQIEAVKQCQELHDVETRQPEKSAL